MLVITVFSNALFIITIKSKVKDPNDLAFKATTFSTYVCLYN